MTERELLTWMYEVMRRASTMDSRIINCTIDGDNDSGEIVITTELNDELHDWVVKPVRLPQVDDEREPAT